ncbi:LysR family transcriptional regulator [Rhizobium rhizogenes]|uniref:HTH-type transcriptional regulator TtuA n=1 Tax=Rhizobium rhizogenes TaxID=359 RepID=A0AA92HBQ8_RHIRH|nr:LysR family transcriptional regulator [Rhizobium rhizogenes]PVE57398.1 LysR family transcriptional regulator [Rhizobium rhizogenes]PVE68923.1 LysR family transcriptional regulator [Agrobacterium tumefaciens]PVE78671.1 LysR family transcriptional regulator [Sphingomonas sp. TPD3009]
MMRPSLTELTAFMAVATHRSFRRAADELGTAPSTLSHTVRALEERLGVRLLNRTTRSVSPTEAGLSLLNRLHKVMNSLDEALDATAAFRGNIAGRVRINAPRVTIAYLVREILPLMTERYPDVEVDLVADGRLIDIVSAGFDAGVRLMEDIPKDMVAVPFGKPVHFLCVASPAYLDRAGEPFTPHDLTQHRCIGHRLPSGKLYKWEFERAGQELTVETSGTVVLDDEDLMIEAAASGLGIAYVVSWIAEPAIAAGKVKPVLTSWMHEPERMALYYPGHRSVPPPLRAFIDVVKSQPSA